MGFHGITSLIFVPSGRVPVRMAVKKSDSLHDSSEPAGVRFVARTPLILSPPPRFAP